MHTNNIIDPAGLYYAYFTINLSYMKTVINVSNSRCANASRHVLLRSNVLGRGA